jgi:hypothetical protein
MVGSGARPDQLMLQPPLGVQFDRPDPPPSETEAKLDTFSSSFVLWHSGHLCPAVSDDFQTRHSNSLPHSVQINSKIGISPAFLFIFKIHL